MSNTAGIRGAITVATNTRESILAAARTLLKEIIHANDVTEDKVAGIFFTTTPDLNAEFPAYAVRDIGWKNTASLCAHEIPVPGAMEMVLRVLMLVNGKTQDEVVHQYIGQASALRPDLAGAAES